MLSHSYIQIENHEFVNCKLCPFLMLNVTENSCAKKKSLRKAKTIPYLAEQPFKSDGQCSCPTCTPTFISMRTSEGSEAPWLQCGGQDVTLSLPRLVLGAAEGSSLVGGSGAAASTSSLECGGGGPAAVFITRSYLLFHSRLIRADKRTQERILGPTSSGNLV